ARFVYQRSSLQKSFRPVRVICFFQILNVSREKHPYQLRRRIVCIRSGKVLCSTNNKVLCLTTKPTSPCLLVHLRTEVRAEFRIPETVEGLRQFGQLSSRDADFASYLLA